MTKPKHPWRCQKCSCTGHTIPRAYPRSKLCAWCADELKKAGQRWCSKGRHGVAPGGWVSKAASMCQACQHDRNQAYRAEHRDEMNAYSSAYHAAHRDEMIAYRQTYYQTHREQLLDQKKAYYQEKRELIKARVRAHRPHIPAASRKERNRHRAKHQIYHHNHKLNQRRRWLASLRGSS